MGNCKTKVPKKSNKPSDQYLVKRQSYESRDSDIRNQIIENMNLPKESDIEIPTIENTEQPTESDIDISIIKNNEEWESNDIVIPIEKKGCGMMVHYNVSEFLRRHTTWMH